MHNPSAVVKGNASSGYGGAGPIGLMPLLRQGYHEFLGFPTLIVAGFVALAALTLGLDNAHAGWLEAAREFLRRFVFAKESGTASLLGTLLGGLLTVISITFSVLLLAVQQTATSLSNQVYSQFLRRRINQLYFGFFLGLAVFDVVALAAAHPGFNPVITATTASVMTVGGLCLLIVLIYSTVDQMRPTVIIESLRDHTLKARAEAQPLLRRTRRKSASAAPVQRTVFADNDGFLQEVDLGRLERLLGQARDPDLEIEILHTIGAFVAYDDRLAVVRARDGARTQGLAEGIKQALELRTERDLQHDPAFGIVQLESIAWTTASSAKSTPEPPRLVINVLRDVLGRWIAGVGGRQDGGHGKALPVVYPDGVHRDAIDAIVTIGLASHESLQHLVIAAALHALGQLLPRAKGELHEHLLRSIGTLIPALSDLILTTRLGEVLDSLRATLEDEGAHEVAAEVGEALRRKQAQRGRLLH